MNSCFRLGSKSHRMGLTLCNRGLKPWGLWELFSQAARWLLWRNVDLILSYRSRTGSHHVLKTGLGSEVEGADGTPSPGPPALLSRMVGQASCRVESWKSSQHKNGWHGHLGLWEGKVAPLWPWVVM